MSPAALPVIVLLLALVAAAAVPPGRRRHSRRHRVKRSRPPIWVRLIAEARRARQLEEFFDALEPLEGGGRAQVLAFARSLSRRIHARAAQGDVPALGNRELYGEVRQLEALLQAVFVNLESDSDREQVIEFAREVFRALPALPAGYFR